MRDMMRNMALSIQKMVTKKVAAKKMVTTNLPSIMITTARRDLRRRDLTITMTLDTRKRLVMMDIITTLKIQAKKEDLIITRNGVTRRARARDIKPKYRRKFMQNLSRRNFYLNISKNTHFNIFLLATFFFFHQLHFKMP